MEQYGFRAGRSTISAVENLEISIKRAREAGKHVLIVTLDLENAFGAAWAPAIVSGLRGKGVNEAHVKLAKSFLEGRSVGCEGRSWPMERGCPQGSSLGPILWLATMGGWFEEMSREEEGGIIGQAYADDQVVIITGNSVKEIERKWERVRGRIVEWSVWSKLKYNEKKTEAMFMSYKGKKIRGPVILMGGQRVEMKDTIRYLGITLSKDGGWSGHVKSIRKKTQQNAAKFFGLARRKWGKRVGY